MKLENEYCISGLHGLTFEKGVADSWSVILKKKFYDLKVGENYSGFIVSEMNPSIKPKKTIIIDGKSIEISEESFEELKKQLCD